MKKILLICFSLTWVTSGFASNPLNHILHLNWPNHATHEVNKSVRSNEDGYTDFSGVWVGTCDARGIKEELVIYNNDSDITLDGVSYVIDGISKLESNGADGASGSTVHLHWDAEGKAILATFVTYHKEGNLSQGGMELLSGKFKLSILNGQLVQSVTASWFRDGSLFDEMSSECVYKIEN
jgi:hypothetical protein